MDLFCASYSMSQFSTDCNCRPSTVPAGGGGGGGSRALLHGAAWLAAWQRRRRRDVEAPRPIHVALYCNGMLRLK